ncbi:MAG: hypothetical protein OEV44_13230 [Spirochaetota bacterium]|nr:hypothetical protein [Spirochaetota bacterium]
MKSVWLRKFFFALLILILPFSSFAEEKNNEKYTHLKVKSDNKGWEIYIDSATIDKNIAKSLYPKLNTPEAAVVYFYASKIRDDDEYKKVLPPIESLSKRNKRKLKYKLEKMSKWKFIELKLVKRKKINKTQYWIKIYMKVSIKGRIDQGTDEAEVSFINGKWYLSMPPT